MLFSSVSCSWGTIASLPTHIENDLRARHLGHYSISRQEETILRLRTRQYEFWTYHGDAKVKTSASSRQAILECYHLEPPFAELIRTLAFCEQTQDASSWTWLHDHGAP